MDISLTTRLSCESFQLLGESKGLHFLLDRHLLNLNGHLLLLHWHLHNLGFGWRRG